MDKYLEYQEHLEKVKENGYYLAYVPEELRTKEMCEVAVNYGGFMLQFVPEELKSPELCLIAVTQEGYAIAFVPEDLKSPELCLIAVKDYPFALMYIPEKIKTQELCKIAVKECLKWIVKYELENLFEKSIPSEFQEGLAEKYDIPFPAKGQSR